MGMIDIMQKPVVARTAVAQGKILLKQSTIDKIRNRTIRKGDPLFAAEIAALHGVKQTPAMIAHCHPIPIENVKFDHEVGSSSISVTVIVKTRAKTGVEMEALAGVQMALLTIWDMVKYLEKEGGYRTMITDVKVLRKTKGESNGS